MKALVKLSLSISVAIFLVGAAWATPAGDLDQKLIKAVKSDKLAEVRVLLQQGASPNATDKKGRCVLVYAFERESQRLIFEELLKAGATVPSGEPQLASAVLLRAIQRGNLEMVPQMKAKGGTLHNDGGGDELLKAAAAGKVELAKLLIEAGADVNYQPKVWVLKATSTSMLQQSSSRERVGWSPLLLAVGNRHLDVARFLLSLGADPLKKMVYQEDPDGQRWLIGRRPDAWGTPLDIAAARNQPAMIAALLAAASSRPPGPNDPDALARPMFLAALQSESGSAQGLSCLGLLADAARPSDKLQAVAHLLPLVEMPGGDSGGKLVNAALAAARAPDFSDYGPESRMLLLAQYFEAPAGRTHLLELASDVVNKAAERSRFIEKASGKGLGEAISILIGQVEK